MKYLKELGGGETFKLDNDIWLVTNDFKASGQRLCYNVQNGFARWIKPDNLIEILPLYTLDSDNNVIPIRQYEKQDSQIS